METQVLFPVFDRAHGKNVKGKASPATLVPNKFDDDDHLEFIEWEFSEDIIDRIEQKWTALGYKSNRVVNNNDPSEPGLAERKRRINFYASQHKHIVTLSIHSNAITLGDNWQSKATGFAYYTSKGATYSDRMATRLHVLSQQKFPEIYHYNHFNRLSEFKGMEADFAVLTAKGNAVLLEIGFQDNREDVEMLLDSNFREKYAQLVADWLIGENRALLQIIESNGRKN